MPRIKPPPPVDGGPLPLFDGKFHDAGYESGYWVFTDLDAGWWAAHRVIEQDQQLVIAEARIIPAPRSKKERDWLMAVIQHPATLAVPSGGLTARRLRMAARTGEALKAARAEGEAVSGAFRRHGLELPTPFTDEALKAPRRVGRRGRTDRFYAEIGARYVAACERGSKSPVADVAKELGDGYSAAYVRDVLNRARSRGLLTRPPRGRAGGRLTDKGQRALKVKREEHA